MQERRAVPRVAVPKPVQAKVKAALPARVLDVSSQGAQLEVVTCMRPGTSCDVRITLPDGEVLLRSVIRRCRAWGWGFDEREQKVLLYRAGVEFHEVPPEILARLSASFLYQLTQPFPEEILDEPIELEILTEADGAPRRAPLATDAARIKLDLDDLDAVTAQHISTE